MPNAGRTPNVRPAFFMWRRHLACLFVVCCVLSRLQSALLQQTRIKETKSTRPSDHYICRRGWVGIDADTEDEHEKNELKLALQTEMQAGCLRYAGNHRQGCPCHEARRLPHFPGSGRRQDSIAPA
jgi:hypothetical protein